MRRVSHGRRGYCVLAATGAFPPKTDTAAPPSGQPSRIGQILAPSAGTPLEGDPGGEGGSERGSDSHDVARRGDDGLA